MSDEKRLRVFADDYVTVIAYDEWDATAVYEDFCGSKLLLDELPGWDEVADEAVITIQMEDARDDGEKVTKRAREWIAESGRGFLCSTEY